ncbi:protein WEAK CHLOROPLAST MOVEMENT UNDER BLUE LIGHT 1 isoform X1 [Carex littledalei]|uniref:Protein WEAK CHLOROPLAST MOVEMENT UNDER BLUE LIGHT 1 isoform X1 n=1 Tax=Carex littledalei TaxID=544730 RepID=A0A833QRT5_9POAL|nr:protein WEAK CHLOROPLAST MOVEMENT UNDER BLUE LIGHT 1 isoform X1 [Carex littledalei]
MFRRCVRDVTSVRSLTRSHPLTITSQMPYGLSARNTLSTSAPKNPSPKVSPSEEEKKSGGSRLLSGLLLGGFILGGSGLAYNYGYFDSFLKDAKAPVNVTIAKNTQKVAVNQDTPAEKPAPLESIELKAENTAPFESIEPKTEKLAQLESVATETEQSAPPKLAEPDTVKAEPELHPVAPSDESINIKESVPEGNLQVEPAVSNVKPVEPQSVTQNTEKDSEEAVNKSTADGGESEKLEQIAYDLATVSRKIEAGPLDGIPPQDTVSEMRKDPVNAETQPPKSLAELYSLQEENNTENTAKENFESANATSSGNSDQQKVVVDLIEAIRAAERQQAESDAYIFAEEKRRLKEKYERELKEARVLLVKKAEEVAMLEKELNKEKARAVATIKGVQEKAQQKLQEELQQKEEEARKQLERVQELAKAELAAAISKEKATQIKRIAEADLNINALCMAFYARSEEARQSHSVHNLALATLGMEDALSKGLPLRGEVELLSKSLEGIDKDTLLSLAISSLPKEALDCGTDTQIDLSIKFNALKGTLRRFSLIPSSGGGMLTHAVARLASSIKIKEDDESGEGIESLITRVENLLVNGKLAEAADALEIGLRGSQAEEAIAQWVRQVRARAIAEQTLSLLQSYASSITFS